VGLFGGQPAEGHRLFPVLGQAVVMGQQFVLLLDAVGVELLDGIADLLMQILLFPGQY
jgi:hypothetical protein